MTKEKRPIQIRFLLVNMLFLIPISLLGIGFYLQSSRIIKDNLYTQTQDLLSTQQVFLSRYIDSYHLAAEEILFDSGLVSSMDKGRLIAPDWTQQELQSHLREIIQRYDDIYYMAINRNGHEELINKAELTENQFLFDIRMITLRESAANEQEDIWMDFFETDRPFLYYNRLIYSVDMQEFLGSLELVFDVNGMMNEMNFLLGRFYPYFVLGDSETGEILKTNLIDRTSISRYLRYQPVTAQGVFRDNQKKKSVSYHTLPYQGWRLMLVVPDAEFFSPLQGIRFLAFSAFSLFLAFCFFLLFWVNRNISNPLKALSGGISYFEQHPEALDLPSTQKDEFGLLFKQFNQMSRELDRYINKDLKEKIRFKEAELKALQAQIKPHFLFNTLETINWIALMQNQQEISEMILSLSALLDAGMGRTTEEYTLSDEILSLQKFVFLYSKRFEGEILFEADLPENLESYPVPPLLLQPIVENALSHNRVIQQPKLSIKIEIRHSGNFLLLQTSDNGQGISPELSDELNKAFSEQRKSWKGEGERKSLGLMNVNLRTRLFYGIDYGLSILSRENEGALVQLRLPYPWEGSPKEEEKNV